MPRKTLGIFGYSFLIWALCLIFPVISFAATNEAGTCILPTPQPGGGPVSGPLGDTLILLLSLVISIALVGFYVVTAVSNKDLRRAGLFYFLSGSGLNFLLGFLAKNIWIAVLQVLLSASFFVWLSAKNKKSRRFLWRGSLILLAALLCGGLIWGLSKTPYSLATSWLPLGGENITGTGYYQTESDPHLAVNSEEDVLMSFAQNLVPKGVYAKVRQNGVWGSALQLSSGTASIYSDAAASGQNIFVVWSEVGGTDDGDVMLGKWLGNGWDAFTYKVLDATGTNKFDQVSLKSSGTNLYLLARLSDGTLKYFTFPTTLSTLPKNDTDAETVTTANSHDPALAVESSGDVHAFWVDGANTASAAMIKHAVRTTSWSFPEDFGTTSEIGQHPDAEANGSKVLAVWQRDQTLDDIRYRYKGDGSFGAETTAAFDLTVNLVDPALTFGGANFRLVWATRGVPNSDQPNVFYKTFDGTVWGTEENVSNRGSLSGTIDLPDIASAYNGNGSHVVWVESSSVRGQDIFYVTDVPLPTPTPTVTSTVTLTGTATQTATVTQTGTITITGTVTITGTATVTPTITQTRTITLTPTKTPYSPAPAPPSNTSTAAPIASPTPTQVIVKTGPADWGFTLVYLFLFALGILFEMSLALKIKGLATLTRFSTPVCLALVLVGLGGLLTGVTSAKLMFLLAYAIVFSTEKLKNKFSVGK